MLPSRPLAASGIQGWLRRPGPRRGVRPAARLASGMGLCFLLLTPVLPAPVASPPLLAQDPPAERAGSEREGARGEAATAADGATAAGFERMPAKIELTRPVQRDLHQIEEQWVQWNTAFYRSEPEQSEALVEGMRVDAEELGFDRLPDLSLGAAFQALRAVREDEDGERASWVLTAAERLDPGRPGTAFARARVLREQGRSLAALPWEVEGYRRAAGLAPGNVLAQANLLLGLLLALLVAAGLFVALQMVARGPAVLALLEGWVGAGAPSLLRRAVALVLLLAPLALPGGLLWLLLWWSALLFARVSPSGRVVLALSWLLLAVMPLVVDSQRRHVEHALDPARRGLEMMVENRLDSRIVVDLQRLTSRLPDSPAVAQLMADFHRGLGQWDLARRLYLLVLQWEPENADAMVALGGYHFVKQDYGNARRYFRQAAEVEPDNVVAHYNLSQAFSEDYLFEEARAALQRAQHIDEGMVSRLQQQTGEERVVLVDGGVARAPEIRRLLAQPESVQGSSPEGGEGNGGSFPWVLLAPLGAAGLAVLLWSVSRGRLLPEAGEDSADGGLGEALLPGLASAREGNGGRAYLALFVPAFLLLLPQVEHMAYPVYPGFGASGVTAWVLAGTGLGLYFALRIVYALWSGGRGGQG